MPEQSYCFMNTDLVQSQAPCKAWLGSGMIYLWLHHCHWLNIRICCILCCAMHKSFWVLCYVRHNQVNLTVEYRNSCTDALTGILKLILHLYFLLSTVISVTAERQLQAFAFTEKGWFANFPRPNLFLPSFYFLELPSRVSSFYSVVWEKNSTSISWTHWQ